MYLSADKPLLRRFSSMIGFTILEHVPGGTVVSTMIKTFSLQFSPIDVIADLSPHIETELDFNDPALSRTLSTSRLISTIMTSAC